jgi:hypothetical protein
VLGDPAHETMRHRPDPAAVDLLFMAFSADIGNQFEFTQSIWANNTGFPRSQSKPRPPAWTP